MSLDEPLEVFKARIAAQLDAHFALFRPAVDAINAGFAATSNARPVNRCQNCGERFLAEHEDDQLCEGCARARTAAP